MTDGKINFMRRMAEEAYGFSDLIVYGWMNFCFFFWFIW